MLIVCYYINIMAKRKQCKASKKKKKKTKCCVKRKKGGGTKKGGRGKKRGGNVGARRKRVLGRSASHRLRSILPFLQTFKDLSSRQRGIMLGHIDDKSCEVVCEAISNVLCNPRVPELHRKRLRRSLMPHKKHLRILLKKGTSKKVKRQKLSEIGGFPLAAILSTAVPLLLDLLLKK